MYWRDAYPDNISDSTPAWLAVEQARTKSSLPALLFSPNKPAKILTGNSFIFTTSLRIWQQIKSNTFPPSLSDTTFKVWKNKGPATLADFYIDKIFATFTQLKEKFTLLPSHFFRFLQAGDFVRKN